MSATIDLYQERIEDELVAAGHFDLVDKYRRLQTIHKYCFVPYRVKAYKVLCILSDHVKRMRKVNKVEPTEYLLLHLGELGHLVAFGEGE